MENFLFPVIKVKVIKGFGGGKTEYIYNIILKLI